MSADAAQNAHAKATAAGAAMSGAAMTVPSVGSGAIAHGGSR